MKRKGLPRIRRGPEGRSPDKRKRSELSARHIQYARALGLLFCVAGFVAIGLGWVRAAGQACVDCQIPYLLSGGAAGLGLLMFGVAMLLMAQVRSEFRRMAFRLDDVLRAALAPATTRAQGNEAPSVDLLDRAGASPNGHGEARDAESEGAPEPSPTGRLAMASGPDPSAEPGAAERAGGRRISGWWEG